ncbi:hypothetical protein F4801DRAFT_560262 [Xylaria longipes]|nr:hypothetical protein F4801DRAFT_560262 [Xylaria longipes]
MMKASRQESIFVSLFWLLILRTVGRVIRRRHPNYITWNMVYVCCVIQRSLDEKYLQIMSTPVRYIILACESGVGISCRKQYRLRNMSEASFESKPPRASLCFLSLWLSS